VTGAGVFISAIPALPSGERGKLTARIQRPKSEIPEHCPTLWSVQEPSHENPMGPCVPRRLDVGYGSGY
jgi:hypothetical protein